MAILGVAGCGSAPQQIEVPSDRQIELLQRGGRAAYEAGDVSQAIHLYQGALDRALLRADPAAVAEASFNLAAAQARARRYDAALETLATADPLTFPSTRSQRRLLTAHIFVELDRLEEAEQALDEVDAADGPSELSIACRGLIAAARGGLATARAAASRLDAAAYPALHARLTGLVAERSGDDAAAAAAYEHEAAAHRTRGGYAATGEALNRAAAAYERLGQTQDATRCFLLAAHSARLQFEMHARRP